MKTYHGDSPFTLKSQAVLSLRSHVVLVTCADVEEKEGMRRVSKVSILDIMAAGLLRSCVDMYRIALKSSLLYPFLPKFRCLGCRYQISIFQDFALQRMNAVRA